VNTPAPPKRRRTLRIVALILGLVVLVLGGAPWWFNAERVAALALSQANAATGLEWRIDGAPKLRWEPMPWLALPKLSVTDAQGTALFSSDSVDVAVPWSTLRGEALVVDAIELNSPSIDLDAIGSWLSAQPEGADAPLPTLVRLVIRNGQLQSKDGAMSDLSLELSNLAEGQEARLIVSGVLAKQDARYVISANASAVLQGTQQALRLESLRFALKSDGGLPNLDAQGRLQLGPTWAMALQGEVSNWPATWGELPQPLAENNAPFSFIASQSGADVFAAPVSLSLSRSDMSAEVLFQPEQVQAWIKDTPSKIVPPVTGKLSMPALTLDGVRMEGVEISVDESAPP
jgi:hypothetical protein